MSTHKAARDEIALSMQALASGDYVRCKMEGLSQGGVGQPGTGGSGILIDTQEFKEARCMVDRLSALVHQTTGRRSSSIWMIYQGSILIPFIARRGMAQGEIALQDLAAPPAPMNAQMVAILEGIGARAQEIKQMTNPANSNLQEAKETRPAESLIEKPENPNRLQEIPASELPDGGHQPPAPSPTPQDSPRLHLLDAAVVEIAKAKGKGIAIELPAVGSGEGDSPRVLDLGNAVELKVAPTETTKVENQESTVMKISGYESSSQSIFFDDKRMLKNAPAAIYDQLSKQVGMRIPICVERTDKICKFHEVKFIKFCDIEGDTAGDDVQRKLV